MITFNDAGDGSLQVERRGSRRHDAMTRVDVITLSRLEAGCPHLHQQADLSVTDLNRSGSVIVEEKHACWKNQC
jgi:hypothetical protein